MFLPTIVGTLCYGTSLLIHGASAEQFKLFSERVREANNVTGDAAASLLPMEPGAESDSSQFRFLNQDTARKTF
jgi:hypothetical protein